MGLPFNKIYKYIEGFTPSSLFAAGEQGAWYDPSDLTTLFQDSAGTTPVTLSPMEQPVGLMLDKSKGLALGAELVTNGTNPTTTTGWSQAFGLSSLTASNNEFVAIATVSGQAAAYTVSTTIGKIYKISLTVRCSVSGQNIDFLVGGNTLGTSVSNLTNTNVSGYFTAIATSTNISVRNTNTVGTYYFNNVSIKEIAGNHAFQATTTNRPLLSARVNLLLSTATLSTQSVTSQATSYTLAFTGTGTVTLSGTATGTLSAGSNTFTATAGTLTLTVSGSVTLADLRPANSGALLPPYQRVTTATDYDTVGFPLYLKCNGTSSAMSTNSINFTATDKMTVVTGVRKLSDAATGIFIEHGVGGIDARAWTISAPRSSVNQNYGTDLRDGVNTTCTVNTSSFPSPTSNTLTVLFDYAGVYESKIRINNSAFFTNTTNLTGNFANYPLYLFSRSTSTPTAAYNFYGAIIRGAQSDTVSVAQTENYMAQKTGITF